MEKFCNLENVLLTTNIILHRILEWLLKAILTCVTPIGSQETHSWGVEDERTSSSRRNMCESLLHHVTSYRVLHFLSSVWTYLNIFLLSLFSWFYVDEFKLKRKG